MRPRLLVLGFFASLAVSSLLFGLACSTSSSPQAQGPLDGSTSADPSTSAETSTSAEVRPTAESQGPSEPAGDITNTPPDGGVVMNNASPPGDGGPSNRLQPIIDVMSAPANRAKFRACFDVWGKQNPGRTLNQTLTLKLKADGELISAEFKPDETDVADKAMEACMASAAKSLKFPASPSEQETKYNHRFEFKAKK